MSDMIHSKYFGDFSKPDADWTMNPTEAYKFLRKNGLNVWVNVGRAGEGTVRITASSKTDKDGRHAGMVVRVEDTTIEDAVIAAARQVNRVASTMRIMAEAAGEDDFADFVSL